MNDTLARELERLANKSFSELKICFIPTAAFADPNPQDWLIRDQQRLLERGAEVNIVSLADLTNTEIEDRLNKADVILIGGGITFYLSYMMQEKGLFELIPKLLETKVYVGISAGSMVVSSTLRTTSQALKNPKISDNELDNLGPINRSSSKVLGLVPFTIRPHLDRHCVKEINSGALERIANDTGITIYAIDDNCAVSVQDGVAAIVGDGRSRIVSP